MRINLNNRPEEIQGHRQITVQQLLDMKKFSYRMLLVRVNDNNIPKDDFATATITEGDKVAVIHLMTGG
jgi:sulfur carrier protein